MKEKILVTGGAGFIGSHIAERLAKDGYRVVVLDNLSTGSRENMKSFQEDVEFIRGDIRNASAVARAMKGADIVIHQAAIRSVPKSVDDPFLTNDVNGRGTLLVLHEAAKRKVRRLVYASSSSVYGDTEKFPQKEIHATKPLSPYGSSKLLGENYCYCYYQNFGLQTVALRYFNVYGPRQNPESMYSAVVPAFISKIQKGERPVVDGTGRQSRDFTFVRDVVEANICSAFASPKAAGKAFNIAGGRDYAVIDILRILGKFLGKAPRPIHGPRRKGDAMRTRADISSAGDLLGWVPKVSFEDGLKETLAWFQ